MNRTESHFQCFCFIQGSLCLYGSVVLPWWGHVACQAQWEYTKAEGDWRLRWQVSCLITVWKPSELSKRLPVLEFSVRTSPQLSSGQILNRKSGYFCCPLFLFLHQPNGRAALLHGEVERSDEKVPPHCAALPRAVPGTVWRLGSQWHHPGSRACQCVQDWASLARLSLETSLSLLQNMYVCPEEESVLMSSFVSTLSALSVKQGKHHTARGRSPGIITACRCGNNAHEINVWLLKWTKRRSLTSERWGWTG